MTNDQLTGKEKTEIAIQTGLQLIPYVGGPLSTAYFSTKQEKRFKRIESFYQELSEQIEQLQLQLPNLDIHDQDKLIALIEELNEKVERESTEQKRLYLKKYLLNTLSTPTRENFDERRFFLDILANMTLIECNLLTLFKQHGEPVRVGDINSPGTDQYAIVGAIGRLKINGLLRAETRSFSIGGPDNSLMEVVSITSFGLRFIDYCLV